MAPVSLKKTIQQYKSLCTNLESKLQQLHSKKTELEDRGFVVIDENPRLPGAARSIAAVAAANFPRESQSSISHKIAARGGISEAREQHCTKSPSSPPNITSVLDASVEQDRVAVNHTHAPAAAVSKGVPQNTDLVREAGRERMPSLIEESVMAHCSDVTSLVSTATEILIESMQLRLSYVQEVLNKLTAIQQENPKLPTPPELLFSRYEEWVERNQRLTELNLQLYDLEKLKFELVEKRSKVQGSLPRRQQQQQTGEIEKTLTRSQFVHSSVQRIQAFFSQLEFNITTSERTRAFLMELLDPKGDRMTLEAQKIQEYVGQCLQPPTSGAEKNEAASPERYEQFMAVLCGYIVEKQREVQGEDLPFDLVFSTIERFLIPKILPAILRHVAQPERDLKIQTQCERFQNVTLDQLRVKSPLQSRELVPFINSITQLRASYFTPTPTGKMYAVVAAAKALYEQLGEMGESSIDGDSFLDLWIYVIIKAGVKDLATNLCFMEGYGNPRLSMDEAGYYLTTLEAAAAFIERLKPEDLRQPIVSDFVVCECAWFKDLSNQPGSCIELVSEREKLEGYKVAVVKDWALNRTRLFRAILLPTGDVSDVAVVSTIRLSSKNSSVAHVEYFTRLFTEPQSDMEGLKSSTTSLGLAVTADSSQMDSGSLISLPTGDYDSHHAHLNYVIQLIRLGCEYRDLACDMVDLPSSIPNQKGGEYVYVLSPPEDSSRYLTEGVQAIDAADTKANTLEQSTRSTSNGQFSQGQRVTTKSDQNSNRFIRSFRRSNSQSPQPEQSSILSIPPSQKPSSPYLLNYSTNRGNNKLDVSLSTFPSQTPDDGGKDDSHSSATKRLLGLFQWRRKRSQDRFSTLPARTLSAKRKQEEDERHDQLQTLSQSFQSQSRGLKTSQYNERRVARVHQPSTFCGAESFAVSSTGTVVGRPNVVTVEVEVHNVDESLELNSESPGRHFSLSSHSHSIEKSTETIDGESDGTMAVLYSPKSSHHSRRRILTLGTTRDALLKKIRWQRRPKSRTEVHNCHTHHLKVPLLNDHLSREEYGSCSDSDETGDNLSRSSSVVTSESSFIDSQPSMTAATYPVDTATEEGAVVVDILSSEFVRKIEWNFKKDHLLREPCTDLRESVSDTIRQGQLYLQRLNYLSTAHKLDGVFTGATLAAVKKFQLAHNAYESKHSVLLPRNGYLTAATLQYLRQAFFTAYASLLRLGYEPDCGESFNPSSTSEQNVKAFFNCVQKFQKDSELPPVQQDGVLGEVTLKKIRQTVRTIRRTL